MERVLKEKYEEVLLLIQQKRSENNFNLEKEKEKNGKEILKENWKEKNENDEENLSLNNDGTRLIPTGKGKEYLYYCLINNDNDYKNKLEKNIVNALDEFFHSYSELKSFSENIS